MELRPEVLNVGSDTLSDALSYAEVRPTPTRNVVVRPAAPPVAAGVPSRHVVAPGETLFAIARERLGDESRWRDILDANPGMDPAKLLVGQRLALPQ